MKKRFLSLLMVFCMLITCVPTVGAATWEIGLTPPDVKNAYTFCEVDETDPIEKNGHGDQEIIFYDEETQEVYLKDLPSGVEITALYWADDDPVPISCTASGNTIKITCTEMPDDAIAKQGDEGYSSELYVTTSDNCVSMLSVRFMDKKAGGGNKFQSAYTFHEYVNDSQGWVLVPTQDSGSDWQEISFDAVGNTALVRLQNDNNGVVSLTGATLEWDDEEKPIEWTVDSTNNTIEIEYKQAVTQEFSSELYVKTSDGEESLLSIAFEKAPSKFLYTEDLDDNEGEDDDEVQIPTTGHVELALFYDGVRVANKGDLDYDDDLLTIKQRETQDGNAYFYISFSDIHQDQNVRIYHEDDTDREYPITFEPVLPKAAFYTEVDTTKDEPEIANIIEHLELIDKKEATVYCCVENRKNLTVDIDWDADETDAGFGVSTLNTDPVEFGGDDGDDYLMYTCKITVTATDDAKGKLDAETSNDAIGELNVRYYVSPEGLSYRDVEIDEDTGVCTVEGPFRKDFEVQFGEWKQAALYLNGVLVDDPTTLTAEDISIWQELITEDENGNVMSWPGLYELRQKEKTDGIIKHTGGKELTVEVGLPDNGFYTSTNFNMDSLVNEFLGDKDFFVTYGETQTLYYYQPNEKYEDNLEFVAMERNEDKQVPTIVINWNAVDSDRDGENEYYKLDISGFTDYFELKARYEEKKDRYEVEVSIAVNVNYDGFAYSNTHRVDYPIGKGTVEVASNAHVGLNFYYDGQLVTDASELKFSDGLSYEMLTWEQSVMKGKDYFWIEFTDINSTAPQTVTYVPTGETITLQPVLPLGALYSSSTPSIEMLIEDFELVDDTVTAYDKTITVYFFAQEDAWFADSFNRNRIVFKNGLQNDLDIAVSNVGAGTSADGIAGNLYELTLTVLSPNDITRDGFTDKVDAVIDLIDDNGDTEEFCIATCFMTHWYMKEGLTYRELFDGEPGRAYFEKYFKDTNGAVVRELEIGETLDCALYFDGELVTDSSKLSGTNATVTAVDAANGIYTVSPTANNGRISYIENGRVADYLEIGPQVPTSNNNNNSSNDSSSNTSKPSVDTSKDTTTATPDATVKGDSASASVSNSVGKELIEQADKNDSAEVVIAPEIKGDVNKTEVKIPANTVGNIGQETDADLTVSTPVADITLPNDGLGDLAAEGTTVEVKAERDGNTVKIEVVAGAETVEKIGSGITVTVPLDNCTSGTVAVIVHADGTREVVPKSVAVDGSVTIPLDGSATIELVDNSKDFNDVPADAWSADAVDFVSARGLFSGTGDGNFSPEMPMSRGMIVTVLHNLESNPASTYTGSFADVADGAWYAEGAKWAAENGIATGLPDGSFGANENISREEFAVMLWRYAGSPKAEGTLDFVDAANSSAYAQEALLWAVENGVMSGKAGIYLDPKGEASRAEVAQMLRSFMENI